MMIHLTRASLLCSTVYRYCGINIFSVRFLCSQLVYRAKKGRTELSVRGFLLRCTQNLNLGSVQGYKNINCGPRTANALKKSHICNFSLFAVRRSPFRLQNHSLRRLELKNSYIEYNSTPI